VVIAVRPLRVSEGRPFLLNPRRQKSTATRRVFCYSRTFVLANKERELADDAERRVNAWIGQGVTIAGRISSTQGLRIDGRVDGTIDVAQHELVLGPGSDVKANVTAKSILIGGALVGNVVATERLQIQATGSVQGDVIAPRLILLEGAVLLGKVDVEGGRIRGDKAAS
jgi:cytoskeletal protein CcmA (bactofilin family)